MKQVWKQLARRRSQLATHPFFIWLNSDSAPLEQRFAFTPVMIDFIMGFADMNKWFLSYADPRNALERGINEHTEEDRTHSRLFYENWYTLELGKTSDWPPGKTLWWLFQSADSAVVRRFGMVVLNLAVNYPDPLVRFAMMEAIEMCGDVFFANTAPIASRLSERSGASHLYYGEYHRARETGHLHTNETAFTRTTLTDEQRRDSELAVNEVFDRFLAVLDQLVRYSQRAVSDAIGHQQDLEDEYMLALTPPQARASLQPVAGGEANLVVSESQVPLARLLSERTEKLKRHPFLDWLRDDDTTLPIEKLQRFVALWGIDIVGYRDFNELVFRYPCADSPAERQINEWSEELATHGVLYLQDWNALQMDQFLRWNMGETIAFYFLSEQTEVHRRNMAKVKKLAFGHKEPLLRWWLMKALETSGGPVFEGTAPIAQAAEENLGIVLNYWANRHHLVHPIRKSSALDDAFFAGQKMTREECDVADRMINTVFDNIEEQLSLSHKEALSGVFLREPASLPPPRMSGIVLQAFSSQPPAKVAQIIKRTGS